MPFELTSALNFANFALGQSYGLTDAVGGAVLEAPLVLHRIFSGTRPSDGCSISAMLLPSGKTYVKAELCQT